MNILHNITYYLKFEKWTMRCKDHLSRILNEKKSFQYKFNIM